MNIKKQFIVGLFTFFVLPLGFFPSTEATAAKASLNSNTITVLEGESKTLKVMNTKKNVIPTESLSQYRPLPCRPSLSE